MTKDLCFIEHDRVNRKLNKNNHINSSGFLCMKDYLLSLYCECLNKKASVLFHAPDKDYHFEYDEDSIFG